LTLEYEYAVFDNEGNPVFILPGDEENAERLARYFAYDTDTIVKRRQVGEWERYA